jgi:hypothetical protein
LRVRQNEDGRQTADDNTALEGVALERIRHQSALPMSQSATGRNMSGCGAWRCATKVATASRVMVRVISAQRSQPGIRKRLRGSCTLGSGWSECGSS